MLDGIVIEMQTRTHSKRFANAVLGGEKPAKLVQILADLPREPDDFGPYHNKELWLQWQKVSASQRALAATRWPYGPDRAAKWWQCSRRMAFMASKLWRTHNVPLIHAVAHGTIGVADALAHVDRSEAELASAIKLVKQHKARSLRQAFEVA